MLKLREDIFLRFKKRYMSIYLLLFVLICMTSIHAESPVKYVDPFICTLGDHGQLYPGAVVPFGMIKLIPDTYPSSLTGNFNLAHSVYNYSDTTIL